MSAMIIEYVLFNFRNIVTHKTQAKYSINKTNIVTFQPRSNQINRI